MRYVLLLLLVSASAQAQTGEIYEFSDVTPEIVGGLAALQSSIVYPAAERAAGHEGTVVLRFVVRPNGRADMVEVVRSISPGLDSAAVAGVRAARFVPGRDKGEVVSVRISLPVRFRILETSARPPAFNADTLLSRLGRPWPIAGLPAPDSVQTFTGERTLAMWGAPQPGVEQVSAAVTTDTLRFVSLRFSPAARTRLNDLARQIADARVEAQPDGFVLAYDLAQHGIPAAADLSVQPERLLLTYRQPACRDVPGIGCVDAFPAVVGGLESVQERVRYPADALTFGESGTVLVAFVVQPDGTLTDMRVVSNSAGNGVGARALETEALRVVGSARFLPPLRGTQTVAAPTSMAISWRR